MPGAFTHQGRASGWEKVKLYVMDLHAHYQYFRQIKYNIGMFSKHPTVYSAHKVCKQCNLTVPL